MTYKKKLIEVGLPLEAINKASAREKSIRHGHPSTLHLWWARRPLAACRAVLFASLVDDPSGHPDEFPTVAAQEKERQRLFKIIEDLVQWKNSNNERVLAAARQEILKYTGGSPPPVYDPFCGGGSIPLEAQRLGLEAYGSDLNPVAVLITKALIELPPKFAGRPPVNPTARAGLDADDGWRGAAGLAEDVRYYGQWMRDEAARRIGHLYPQVELPEEYGGGKATVIAWLWARTVKCPNPACGCQMPLVRSFWLSTKKGKEAWVTVQKDKGQKRVSFQVVTGKGKAPKGTVNRRGARCICCGGPVGFDYIRSEGRGGCLGAQLMAIVAEGPHGRLYLSPDEGHESVANIARPMNAPETDLPEQALGFRVQRYGMTKHRDLFTPRQLVALTTFSDLVGEARARVLADAMAAGLPDDGLGINDGGTGAQAYADAVATYLALAVDKLVDYSSNICSWHSGRDTIRNTFARQAIPMTWDFAEANPFSSSTGNFLGAIKWIYEVLVNTVAPVIGRATQQDATSLPDGSYVLSTDPPYYDNIGYADLADFFYIWLRRNLQQIYPDLFSTMLVPKTPELVATPYRFGGDREQAKEFFEDGLRRAFAAMKQAAAPGYPLTVYYAFKQKEEVEADGDAGVVTASTGWETMLQGLVAAGFAITGTWPMRSELSNRPVANGTNALASSIVLVCRPRPDDAPVTTLRDFISALRRELPPALRELQQGNIAPVDLAQSAIGPGMAIYSRYRQVLEANGTPLTVRRALQLINQELDAYLSAQEGDMDPATRFGVAWFEQYRMDAAPFGEAEVMTKAKNTSIDHMQHAGMLSAARGKVALLTRDELPADWSPHGRGDQAPVWLAAQHLVKRLLEHGEEAAARLAHQLGPDRAERAKALAYRLYTICERKGWTDEALAYNALVVAWPSIQAKVAAMADSPPVQSELDFKRGEE